MKQTKNNVIILGILVTVFGGVSDGLINRELKVGLTFGISFGVMVSVFYGAGAIIQHYLLCVAFVKFDLLPWNLISFLKYAVDLIFLRRVGGSYIFVHRLLMEHFAEMYIEKENKAL